MGAGDGLGKSIAEFFANLTKEPAEEFGGLVTDGIKFWRMKQAVRLKDKVEHFLREPGITDKRAIPLKLTVAIVDGGTIEGDDGLHTFWAKLLTNSLDPSFTEEVRIAYAEILRALSPFDARVLSEINKQTLELANSLNQSRKSIRVDLSAISREINSTRRDMLLSADCLLRQRLIFQTPNYNEAQQVISNDGSGDVDGIKWVNIPPQITGFSIHLVALTDLGFAFIKACE